MPTKKSPVREAEELLAFNVVCFLSCCRASFFLGVFCCPDPPHAQQQKGICTPPAKV